MNLPIRPLAALSLALLIFGGMQTYMMTRAVTPPPIRMEQETDDRYSLEITLTFDAGPDPFAFDLEQAPSLLVTLAGREILRRLEPLSAGDVLRIEKIQGVVAGQGRLGRNELFLQATPQQEDSSSSRAVRARLFRNDQPILDHTLWSEPGEPVRGTIEFAVAPRSSSPYLPE